MPLISGSTTSVSRRLKDGVALAISSSASVGVSATVVW